MMGDIAIRISDIHVTFGDHKVLKGRAASLERAASSPSLDGMAAGNRRF